MSILQKEKQCFICKSMGELHKHHVYGGGRRQISEKWGCVVWLCPMHHNMSNFSVHFNHDLDMMLKKDCQRKFEELYGHEKFMEVFKKNYL